MAGERPRDIYDYGDYRQFIRDFFAERKSGGKGFSLAVLGQKAGLSKVAVKYLLDGRRHIASDSIDRWSTCLGLKREEAEFFRHLVLFNKARSHAERALQFDRMLALRGQTLRCRYLDASTIGYFQAWYYPAIAEMSYLGGFVADPEWIRPRLAFPVSPKRIAQALSYLRDHGYLREAALPPASPAKVKTPDELASHVYKSFVLEQTTLSAKAIESQPREDREAFTLTVSVDQARYELVKQRLAAIRHELHDLLANTDPAERVIQVNLQMFTVAKGSEHA